MPMVDESIMPYAVDASSHASRAFALNLSYARTFLLSEQSEKKTVRIKVDKCCFAALL